MILNKIKREYSGTPDFRNDGAINFNDIESMNEAKK